MRILVVSDTHGGKRQMEKIIPIIKDEVDLIIHAGDNFKDSIYLKDVTKKPVMAVAGNCDFENVERNIDFECEGVNIFLTHGNSFGVKYGLKDLVREAKKRNANIAIFGHTHCKEDKIISGVQVINPGSLSLPRDDRNGSYVMLDIENGSFTYEYRFI